MKIIKIIGVIALFGIAFYLATNFKKRIVQNTCDLLGNHEAMNGEDIIGSYDKEEWFCCPKGKEKSTDNCVPYTD